MVKAIKCVFVWYDWIQSHCYHQVSLESDVFEYSELTKMCMVSDYIECIFVRFIYHEFSCVIGAMYRPLNSNIVMFNEKLNDILSQVSHMSYYIIGDFNIHRLKHGSH